MVVFCSKIKIYCEENNENVRISKFSCKGLNKSNFSYFFILYNEVLFNQLSVGEMNCGFCVCDYIILFIYMYSIDRV